MPKDDTEEYLKELMADYRQKKQEYAQKQEQEKMKNLKLKEEIIEKIKGRITSYNVCYTKLLRIPMEADISGICPHNISC